MVFEGIRSSGPYGDIALDELLIVRLGDATTPTKPSPFGLPIICNFEVGNEPSYKGLQGSVCLSMERYINQHVLLGIFMMSGLN